MKVLSTVLLIGVGYATTASAQKCPMDWHCPNNPYGASSPFSGSGTLTPYRSPPTFLNKPASNRLRPAPSAHYQETGDGGWVYVVPSRTYNDAPATYVYSSPPAYVYVAPPVYVYEAAPVSGSGPYTFGGYVPYGQPVGPTPQN